MAIIYAGAADQPPHHRRRVGSELRQQRFQFQGRQQFVRHVGDNQVLFGSQAYLPVTVGIGQAGYFQHLCCGNPTHGNHQAHVVQACFLLGVDADVVGLVLVACRQTCSKQGLPHPLLQFSPESVCAPFLHQEGHAGFVAGFPGSVVAEQQGNFAAKYRRVPGQHEHVQVRGRPKAAGTLLAAHGHVEAMDLPASDGADGRGQCDILGDCVGAVVQAAGDGDVKLAGQVGEFPVAHEDVVVFPHHAGRIEQFVGGKARHRAPYYAADVVHARLQRHEPHRFQPVPDARHLVNLKPPELDLLAGSQVGEVLAEVAADFGDSAELGRVADAIGDTQPHHEMARCLAPEEDSQPLKTLLVTVADGLPSLAGVAGQVVPDVQPVFLFLVDLNLVHDGSPCCSLPCRPPGRYPWTLPNAPSR